MPSLQEQLADFQAAYKARVPAERVTLIETAIAELRDAGIEASVLGTGAALPLVTLWDAAGCPMSLQALNRSGPLVSVFYRGGWCPYCNLELHEWQRALPELRRLGATLVAISPQTPDNSMSTLEENDLDFPVLSDSNFEAAKAFGLAFTIPSELVALYAQLGNDLPKLNGNGLWVLPVPATYLVGRDGKVAYAHRPGGLQTTGGAARRPRPTPRVWSDGGPLVRSNRLARGPTFRSPFPSKPCPR